MDETWRLHPEICNFTSEIYYEGELNPRPDVINQVINGTGMFGGAGLRYLPVDHVGNTASSYEEVNAIEQIVNELLGGGVTITDKARTTKKLTEKDLLIVAPYNAQVAALKIRLRGLENRIGTVDKFQGQQAPVGTFVSQGRLRVGLQRLRQCRVLQRLQ